MRKELIIDLFRRFEEACYLFNGIECWSARELQEILGYSKWDNFKKIIEKAKISCEKAGIRASGHFADVGKMVELGSKAAREIDDIALTRLPAILLPRTETLQ